MQMHYIFFFTPIVFNKSYFFICIMINRNQIIIRRILITLLLFTTQAEILYAQGRKDVPQTRMEIPLYDETQYKQYIEHKGFDLVYNSNTRLPEWVAYELTDIEVEGVTPRGNNFVIDPDVKGIQADNEDYRNSGWDRGHMAPAGDMKIDKQTMLESFYFSNICPQNRNLNGGDWKSLEELVRDYARQFSKVYVVCGPIVGNNIYGRLGPHQVVIPDSFFKVLLVETKSGYESIGFIMDNEAGHKKLSLYAKTIDEIENITGLDFFHLLPDKIEQKIESQYELSTWGL